MRNSLQRHAIILAALLQLLPLVRTVFTHPAVASTWAVVIRWAIGGTAALGAFDSVSGATSVFTTPNTFSGAVGTPFSTNVTVSIGGGNSAASSDYLYVSSAGVNSPLLLNNQSTTLTMPPGLTFTAAWVNGASTIGGKITGTPTSAGTFPTTVTIVSPGNASLSQAITITITGQTVATAPSITTQPIGASIAAGKNATFTVGAGGTAPLNYRWSKNGSPLADGGNLSGSGTTTLTVANVAATDAGNYSVTVTNTVGSATSSSATLAVILPPGITTQPLAQNAAAGGSATFSVVTTGTTPLSFSWLKNGVAVANGIKFAGANTGTLTISGIAAADAGNYSVIVTNLAGSVTSAAAGLTFVSSPVISTSPSSQTVAVGANVSLTVSAAGSAPLNYFWLKNGGSLANGGNLSGAGTATLNLTSVTTNDAAAYSVIVSNTLGSVTSASATLAVIAPPMIVTPPANIIAQAGTTAAFTVSATGSAPLNFQWRKNGNPLVNGGNISGANTATLTFSSLTVNDTGTFSVTVSNVAGSVTSVGASLTVLSPPVVIAQPASTTVVLGANATFGLGLAGTAPLTCTWFKNGNPITGGYAYAANSNTLTLTSVTTNDAGSYYAFVTNAIGSVTSLSATLTVIVPPVISSQPANATILAGSNVTFSVTANGSSQLNFQWRKNGTPLVNGGNVSGATSAALTLTGVTANDAANYFVTVGNTAGTASSSNAVLAVLLPPAITVPPANQIGAEGSSVSLTVTATGTDPLSYQWLKHGNVLADGGIVSGAQTRTLTLTGITTNDVDFYSVTVSNPFGSATSASASVTMNIAPRITTQPANQNAVRSNTVTFTATATGAGPLVYQWRKNNANIAGANQSTLTLNNVATNNNGNYSLLVTNIYGRATSSVATLKVFIAPAFTLQAGARAARLGTNTVFRATVSGTAPINFQWFKDGEPLVDGGNLSGAFSNVLTVTSLTTNDGGAYSLVANNLAGDITSSNALLKILLPLAITDQPDNQAIVLGNPVTFIVGLSGTAPMKFQWRKAGVNLVGATNASFTIASVKTNDAAAYSVSIANVLNTVVSSNAALKVLLPPVFTLQATNRTVNAGIATIFRAAVKGTAPFSYQWLKDGTALVDDGNISGSLSNVLSIASATASDAGAYSLAVTNAAAGVVSSNAVLTVKTNQHDDGEDGDRRSEQKLSQLMLIKKSASQVALPVAAQFTSIVVGANRTVTLSVQSDANARYILQATTDCLNWTDIGTNTADALGAWQATDAADAPAKFYRLKSLP